MRSFKPALPSLNFSKVNQGKADDALSTQRKERKGKDQSQGILKGSPYATPRQPAKPATQVNSGQQQRNSKPGALNTTSQLSAKSVMAVPPLNFRSNHAGLTTDAGAASARLPQVDAVSASASAAFTGAQTARALQQGHTYLSTGGTTAIQAPSTHRAATGNANTVASQHQLQQLATKLSNSASTAVIVKDVKHKPWDQQQPLQEQPSTANSITSKHINGNTTNESTTATNKACVRTLSRSSHSAKESDQTSSDASGAWESGALTPAQALRRYQEYLTPFEQSEILDYQHIYFIGRSGAPKIAGLLHSNKPNNGYDDDRGDYVVVNHDHLGFRYEVLGVLGKGSFGQVVKVHDFKCNCLRAIKIIRNKKRFHHQALVELKVLQQLKQADASDENHVIHIQDHFMFRNHLCISFELMSVNLFEFLKQNHFVGLSMALIRRFAHQILITLRYLKSLRIIHCDLKPENILLRHPNRSLVKVIDFGSSCFTDERVYTYIQSRFYRSPEIILGLKYGCEIDMWSFGAILAELYTGYPLFPGEDEVEQLACIMEVLGQPSEELLSAATRRKLFFEPNGAPKLAANSQGKLRQPGSRTLAGVVRGADSGFIDLLAACLRWDPVTRITPEEALAHPWIAGTSAPSPAGQALSRSNTGSVTPSTPRATGGQHASSQGLVISQNGSRSQQTSSSKQSIQPFQQQPVAHTGGNGLTPRFSNLLPQAQYQVPLNASVTQPHSMQQQQQQPMMLQSQGMPLQSSLATQAALMTGPVYGSLLEKTNGQNMVAGAENISMQKPLHTLNLGPAVKPLNLAAALGFQATNAFKPPPVNRDRGNAQDLASVTANIETRTQQACSESHVQAGKHHETDGSMHEHMVLPLSGSMPAIAKADAKFNAGLSAFLPSMST